MAQGHPSHPAMFIDRLSCKAVNAGKGVEDIDSRRTKLSQSCICGQLGKETAKAAPPPFTPHPARYCSNHTLDISQAKAARSAAKPLRRRAKSRLNKTAKSRAYAYEFRIPETELFVRHNRIDPHRGCGGCGFCRSNPLPFRHGEVQDELCIVKARLLA